MSLYVNNNTIVNKDLYTRSMLKIYKTIRSQDVNIRR